jgi:large subunit ribosomal protein L29
MKSKEIKELRDSGPAGLQEKLQSLKEEQFNLRFQTQIGEVNNPLRLRLIRRDIARVSTLLRESALLKSQEQKKA